MTTPARDPVRSAGRKAIDLVSRFLSERGRVISPRGERVALVVSIGVFVAAAVVAYINFPETDEPIRWVPILVAGAVGAPATMLLNAYEYQASGLALRHRIPLPDALKITTIGAAANLLPIPGSVIVRVRALSGLGSTYGQAIGVSGAVGGIYVGVTLLVAGTLQLVLSTWLLGLAFSLAGLVAAGVGYGLLSRHAGTRAPRIATRLVGIEGTLTLLGGLRLFLVLYGLGFDTGIADAVALTVAGSLTTAMGIFPAGLGMREFLVAAISPLVGITATAGLAAAVVDRIARFIVIAVGGTIVLRLDARERR